MQVEYFYFLPYHDMLDSFLCIELFPLLNKPSLHNLLKGLTLSPLGAHRRIAEGDLLLKKVSLLILLFPSFSQYAQLSCQVTNMNGCSFSSLAQSHNSTCVIRLLSYSLDCTHFYYFLVKSPSPSCWHSIDNWLNLAVHQCEMINHI